jgi:hypothetical protein
MESPADLASVVIDNEKGQTVRAFISEADASRLANITGCVIRVERIFVPDKAAPAAPRPKGSTVEGSVTERVLKRMAENPERTFRAGDFADLGLPSKRIHSALFRLRTESKKIRRVASGAFKLARTTEKTTRNVSAPSEAVSGGATSQTNVMAFMRKHPGTPLRAGEVATGMGLTSKFRPSISSSLKRLVTKGDLTKSGSQFTREEGASG